MEEEPWDELMGPPDEEVRKAVLRIAQPPVRSSGSVPTAPPPSAAFHGGGEMQYSQMDPPTTDYHAAAASYLAEPYKATRTMSLPIEDEEDEDGSEADYLSAHGVSDDDNASQNTPNGNTTSSNNNEQQESAYKIRQDALKVLEVADDQLAHSSHSVYRTVGGGFMASAEPINGSSNGTGSDGGGKRVARSALSGLKYTASRTRFRDNDPFATNGDAVVSPRTTMDDREYGDQEAVLDAMERRASASRPSADDEASSGSNKWSSRYSMDNTLLALSGGRAAMASASSSNNGGRSGSYSSRFLDRMDQDQQRERRASRNLFGGDRNPAASGVSVFGSGFDFRQKFVFGKQGVTASQQNLRTAFNAEDEDRASSLPPASPRKSWQEQLAKQQRQRRYLFLTLGVLFVLFVTVASVMGHRKRIDSISASAEGIPQDPVTFYVTSDAPYSFQESQALVDYLQSSLDPETKFFVHLGNLQDASVSLCQESRYRNVALLLQNSPVPTFVLPGQEDWPNCPDPDRAWEFWEGNFLYFEDAFGKKMETNVARQIKRLENFAFVQSGVLVLGVHVVGGRMTDGESPFEESDKRNSDNLEWVRYMTSDLGREARAVVVLGNASPGQPQNKGFFDEMSAFLQLFGKPAAYVHANSGEGGDVEQHRPFDGAEDVLAVQVTQGGKNPPVRITVGTGNQPFTVS